MTKSIIAKSAATAFFLSTLVFIQAMVAAEEDAITGLGESGGDPVKFGRWWDSFRKAVSKDDKRTVAKMIQDPLLVNRGGEYDSFTGKTSKGMSKKYHVSEVLVHYNEIFNHDLKRRIATGKKSEFWGRDIGISLGNGSIWINSQDKGNEYKLCTINMEAVPADPDPILARIKSGEKAAGKTKLAALYSELGRAYDGNWRCIHSSHDVEEKAFKDKEEAAFKQALSLRTGTAAGTIDQAKDLKWLGDVLSRMDGRNADAIKCYQQAYDLEKKVLPPDSSALKTVKSDLDRISKKEE